jgi:NADPH:quinone reductase-like Zn-dependent oxidoreductase
MSRAVIHETFGGPEVLRLRGIPEPHAGPDEVRARVAATGLNPMDWAISSPPETAAQFGTTVPSGFAGVLDEVGDAAAGGVGVFAAQLAKLAGATSAARS